MDAALKPVADLRGSEAEEKREPISGGWVAKVPPKLSALEPQMIAILQRWGTVALRLTLGMVFLWFGALKVFGVSPATQLVKQTFSFLPFHPFFLLLGFWEMAIGCGMITRLGFRFALALLWLHLVGTFAAIWLAPRLFFVSGNPTCLTMEGEFVVKNLVLMAAGLVVAGHELQPLATGPQPIKQKRSKTTKNRGCPNAATPDLSDACRFACKSSVDDFRAKIPDEEDFGR